MEQNLADQRDFALQAAGRIMQARKLYKEGVALLENNNYQQGGECIVQAAQMGEPAAEDHVGFLYERGFFGDPDYAHAVYWYRKSADHQFANGQFHMGACYQLGNGVEQSYSEAMRWFAMAAKAGHAEAIECLEMLRDMGVEEAPAPPVAPPPPEVKPEPVVQKPAPVEVRVEEPVAEEPAPRKKRAEAERQIQTMPELPADLDDPTVADAVAAYQAQAMQSDAAAQLKLGLAYHKGRSAPVNPKLACFWVMRSMLAGSYQAAQFLQFCVQAVPPEEQGKLQSTIFMWAPGQPVPQL